MNIHIRPERHEDFQSIFNLVKQAFEAEEMSDHTEHHLVSRLRCSSAFIPDLALVAETNEQIVGYILLTKIKVISKTDEEFESLALAPVAVLPGYQGKGVGALLIQSAHKRALDLGFQSIILLGHEHYYPRFGYHPLKTYGIKLPFEVPEENCMAIELVEGALTNVNGIVHYPKEFGLAE